MAADTYISDWLNEWRQKDACCPLAAYDDSQMLDNDDQLLTALISVFSDFTPHQLLEPVCSQLLQFYRSRRPQLVSFCVQFMPCLIHFHLNCVAHRRRKCGRPVEVLLLGVYNLEVVDIDTGRPHTHSFRMPTLIKQSIYHEPMYLTPSSLTEHSISRLQLGDNFTVDWGPFTQVEQMNACNRDLVLSVLLALFCRQLSNMRCLALEAACHSIIRICGQGFDNPALQSSSSKSSSERRLPVSAYLMLQMVHIVQFVITPSLCVSPAPDNVTYRVSPTANSTHRQTSENQRHRRLAVALVTVLQRRASYQLYPAVLASINALKHQLFAAVKTDDSVLDGVLPLFSVGCVVGDDREMSPLLSFSSSTNNNSSTLHKSIITNASFRTKKLPDDIPIKQTSGRESQPLSAINEDCDENCDTSATLAAKTTTKTAAEDTGGSRVRMRDRVGRQLSRGLQSAAAAASGGGGGGGGGANVAGMIAAALPALKRRSTGALERKRNVSSESGSATAGDSLELSALSASSELVSCRLSMTSGARSLNASDDSGEEVVDASRRKKCSAHRKAENGAASVSASDVVVVVGGNGVSAPGNSKSTEV